MKKKQDKKQDAINFHNLYGYFYFPQRSKIKTCIYQLLQQEQKTADSINYIFCTDEYLLQINQQYLQHHTYTDIVTFELSEKNEPLVADIFISIDRIKENAEKFGCSFKKELLRVIFHGALHLSGYKDKNEKEKKKMREKEDFYLNLFTEAV